jgi:YVTN family beta-propeller protein
VAIFQRNSLTFCALLTVGLVAACAEYQTQQSRSAPVVSESPARSILGPRIYVANESSNDVSVIDAERLQPIGTIDARNHATHDLAVSRDGKMLFATNLASGRLSVIDTEKMETVASIYTGARSHVVTLTNDNRQAWIANIGEDNLAILDINTLKIIGFLPTGKGPTGMAFSRDGRFAYVSNQGDKTVSVIEVDYQRIIKTIPVGTNPHFLILGPDGRIWGCNTGSNDIYVIDTNSHEIVGSFQVGPFPQQIAFGFKGLSGPNAYVTVAGFNKVLVLSTDLKRMNVLEEIEVGERPNGIWANSQGTRIFVANEGSNDVRIIDTGTSQIIGTVPVGRKPIRVVVSR